MIDLAEYKDYFNTPVRISVGFFSLMNFDRSPPHSLSEQAEVLSSGGLPQRGKNVFKR